jgi:hypothetical protein
LHKKRERKTERESREYGAHEVIEVEKTVSPKMLRGAPNERPVKDWPVLRWRTAGMDVDVDERA